jgi:hypothetical protein
MGKGRPRKYLTPEAKAEAQRRHVFDSQQRRKERQKNCKDVKKPEGNPEGKPAISFLVYVPPYIPLEPKPLEGSVKPIEATPDPERYKHLAKGLPRPGAYGRPVKYRTREEALQGKKESDHRRYLRRREQRQREKQAPSESTQAIPGTQRQLTATNESQDMQLAVPEELQPLLSKITRPDFIHHAPAPPDAPAATLSGIGLRISPDIPFPCDPIDNDNDSGDEQPLALLGDNAEAADAASQH